MPEFLRIFGCALLAAYTVAPRQSTPPCLTYLIWRYKCALQHTHLREAIAIANKFAARRLLRIFGCALLAAYTVAPRQSSPRCLTYLIWRYSVPCSTLICRNPLQLQASLHRIGFLQLSLRFLYLQMGRQIFLLCSRLLRIFA